MVRQKTRPMTLKLPPVTDDALGAIADALKLDRSATLRFLVHEKARALGLLTLRTEAPMPVDDAPARSATRRGR